MQHFQTTIDTWAKTQDIPHNPDQVAGGRPDSLGGLGHKGVNRSIGSQWEHRVDALDDAIMKMAEGMTPEQMATTKLNVKLTGVIK